MAKKKELKQIVMSWHKAAGVTVGWQQPTFSYVSDDDYEIVAIDMEVEAFSSAACTQVLGAQLSFDAEPFDSLSGAIQDAARRRCLMSLNSNCLLVTQGGVNFWRGKTIVFPPDARPQLDEDDQLNLHIFSSTNDKAGQVTAIIHVKPR